MSRSDFISFVVSIRLPDGLPILASCCTLESHFLDFLVNWILSTRTVQSFPRLVELVLVNVEMEASVQIHDLSGDSASDCLQPAIRPVGQDVQCM